MSTIWRISLSRPRTGSIFPARAIAVRSIVNCPSAAEPAGPETAPPPSAEAGAPSCIPAAAAASLLPATIAVKSRFSVSAGIFSSWPEASRARRASVSSASRAHRRCPDCTRDRPCSTEANQPSLLGELDNFRRQAGSPGIAGPHTVERPVEVDRQPAPGPPRSGAKWRRCRRLPNREASIASARSRHCSGSATGSARRPLRAPDGRARSTFRPSLLSQ